MFEKLVVSAGQRRSRRTVKFFVCTSITYLSVVAFALVLSICLETPKLADSSDHREVFIAPPAPLKTSPVRVDSGAPPPLDLSNVRKFEDLAVQPTSPPRIHIGVG